MNRALAEQVPGGHLATNTTTATKARLTLGLHKYDGDDKHNDGYESTTYARTTQVRWRHDLYNDRQQISNDRECVNLKYFTDQSVK